MATSATIPPLQLIHINVHCWIQINTGKRSPKLIGSACQCSLNHNQFKQQRRKRLQCTFHQNAYPRTFRHQRHPTVLPSLEDVQNQARLTVWSTVQHKASQPFAQSSLTLLNRYKKEREFALCIYIQSLTFLISESDVQYITDRYHVTLNERSARSSSAQPDLTLTGPVNSMTE